MKTAKLRDTQVVLGGGVAALNVARLLSATLVSLGALRGARRSVHDHQVPRCSRAAGSASGATGSRRAPRPMSPRMATQSGGFVEGRSNLSRIQARRSTISEPEFCRADRI